MLAAAALLAAPAAALAQASPEARRDALFAQMMADPANVDIALEYAALSQAAGDLEGAVSTLERMKIFAPDVARIRYELGVLYFRMEAYEVAASNLQAAAASTDLAPELRDTIPGLLDRIADTRRVNRFAARISAGVRYQTNANVGAINDTISLNGINFRLNNTAMAQADANAFVSGVAQFSHDLQNQGDRIEATFAAYGAYQQRLRSLNVAQFETRIGPAFNLQRFGLSATTLRLYGIGGVTFLDDRFFRHGAGGGLELAKEFDMRTRGAIRLQSLYQTYYNSPARPTIANRTGLSSRLAGRIERTFGGRFTPYLSLHGQRTDARVGDERYWEAGGLLGARFAFSGPGQANRPWVLDVSAGAARRTYDAPDFIFSPVPRSDWEYVASAGLEVPIGDEWGLSTTVSYRHVESTYGLHTLNNLSASLAVTKSF